MSYFHTGTRTIIGAEAFHCPVRDGKEWDHLAMVIRLKRSLFCMFNKTTNSQSRSPLVEGENQIFDCTTNSMKSDITRSSQFDRPFDLKVKVIGSSLTGN